MKGRRKQNNFFPFLFLFFLSLALFYSSPSRLVRGLRGFFERPILFLEGGLVKAKQRFPNPFSYLLSRQEDFLQKAALEKEIRELTVRSGTLSVCLEENEAMRRLLGAPHPSSWHFIPARVLGCWQDVKINVGEKAGVKEGMMVISEDLLVGKIISVQKHSSNMILVTDPRIKIPVIIRGQSRGGVKARGILTGYFEEKLILTQVLKTEEIVENDLVFTSGEIDSFDSSDEVGWLPDLLIGKIDKVEEGKEKVFKKAWVSSLIDYSDLKHVFVVKIM